MDTNIYDCCDSNSDFTQIISEDNNDQNCYNSPVNKTLRAMGKDICEMRVTLSETKATLLFLVQIMCARGTLCDIEKSLLINLENGLNDLGCELKENSNNLSYLDCLLH